MPANNARHALFRDNINIKLLFNAEEPHVRPHINDGPQLAHKGI